MKVTQVELVPNSEPFLVTLDGILKPAIENTRLKYSIFNGITHRGVLVHIIDHGAEDDLKRSKTAPVSAWNDYGRLTLAVYVYTIRREIQVIQILFQNEDNYLED